MHKQPVLSITLTAILYALPSYAVDVRKEPSSIAAPTQPVAIKTLESKTPGAVATQATPTQPVVVPRVNVAEPRLQHGQPAALEREIAKVASQPVSAQDAPSHDNTMLEAILNRTDERNNFVTSESAQPTQEEQAENEGPGWWDRMSTGVRVFAIRWREVLDIIFIATMAVFTGLMYRTNRNQKVILMKALQAAEIAAFTAQKNTEIVESALGRYIPPDRGNRTVQPMTMT